MTIRKRLPYHPSKAKNYEKTNGLQEKFPITGVTANCSWNSAPSKIKDKETETEDWDLFVDPIGLIDYM